MLKRFGGLTDEYAILIDEFVPISFEKYIILLLLISRGKKKKKGFLLICFCTFKLLKKFYSDQTFSE
jgi:hypothetical protein